MPLEMKKEDFVDNRKQAEGKGKGKGKRINQMRAHLSGN